LKRHICVYRRTRKTTVKVNYLRVYLKRILCYKRESETEMALSKQSQYFPNACFALCNSTLLKCALKCIGVFRFMPDRFGARYQKKIPWPFRLVLGVNLAS